MTVSVAQTRERRIENSAEWIRGVCERFTDAAGWPMGYLAMGDADPVAIESQLETNPKCCWYSAVSDGERGAGFLYLEHAHDSSIELISACLLADVVSDLTGRLLTFTSTLESRTQSVSTLVDVGLSLHGRDDPLDILQRLLQAVANLTGLRSAAFFLLDSKTNRLNLRLSHHLEAESLPYRSRELAAGPPDLDALTHGRVLLHRCSAGNRADWLPNGIATGVCVGVQSESVPLGTLWAFDRRTRTLNEADLQALESVAAQIASVLERVVLLTESATQQRLQQELRIASRGQASDKVLTFPDSSGFEAAAWCRSRYEIGGDLCELLPLNEHQTAVVVGDASGDSIPAALVMTAARGALHSLLTPGLIDAQRTVDVVERLNRSLVSITPMHQFMSLLFGVLDVRDMTFTYTNAGHPVPLHVRNGEVRSLESHGLILGVTATATYEQSVISLAKKDMLTLFTDGITEARNAADAMFRSDGIAAAIQAEPRKSARDTLDRIWQSFERHAEGHGALDDRTLLVIRMS